MGNQTSNTRRITFYRIRGSTRENPINYFKEVIKKEGNIVGHGPIDFNNFSAKLFTKRTGDQKPSWVNFLKEGFGELKEIKCCKNYHALLLVKFWYKAEELCYAIAFGSGRFMIDMDYIVPNFGMKTLLNMISESIERGEGKEKVKGIKSKQFSDIFLSKSHQADILTNLNNFGIDIETELINTLEAKIENSENILGIISGGDKLSLTIPISFESMANFCLETEAVYRREDYKGKFPWYDHMHIINRKKLKNEIGNTLVEQLKKNQIDRLTLCTPEIFDFEKLNHFKYNIIPGEDRYELDLSGYLYNLKKQNKLHRLSINMLKQSYKIDAIDIAGAVVESWSVFKCLNGEIKHEGKTYLLYSGVFIEILQEYLNDLNTFVKKLKISSLLLPNFKPNQNEEAYNKSVVTESQANDFLFLDRKTVKISPVYSPIEICDLLSKDKEFIHVKRKHNSSALSHLFSQGFVSAELFYNSSEFRAVAGKVVQKESKVLFLEKNDPMLKTKFNFFDNDRVKPGEYTVVFAIIANWGEIATLMHKLPFFSKINLRRTVQDLERIGYKVEFVLVNIEGGGEKKFLP